MPTTDIKVNVFISCNAKVLYCMCSYYLVLWNVIFYLFRFEIWASGDLPEASLFTREYPPTVTGQKAFTVG